MRQCRVGSIWVLCAMAGCSGLDLGGGETCASLVAPTTDHFADKTTDWTLSCAGEPTLKGRYAVGPARHTDTVACQGTEASTCVPCDPAWGVACGHSMPGVVADLKPRAGPGVVSGGFRQLCGGMGGGSVSLVFARVDGTRIRCETALLDGVGSCYSVLQSHPIENAVDDCTFTTQTGS